MSKKTAKKLFAYVYSKVPEGIEKKIASYKEKGRGAIEVEYISKKTYKALKKETENYNAHLPEGEEPKMLSIEGFTKIKKAKKKKDALLRVTGEVVESPKERTGSGDTDAAEKRHETYEFDVSKKKGFCKATRGYFYTSAENKFVAITRSYLIPFILVIALLIGFGGYGVYRYITPITDSGVEDFKPDIDEDINQKQEGGEVQHTEGIRIDGFSKWTVEAGRKEDVPIALRNSKGNPCYFTFEIILDDTKEVLYKSKMVPPGEGIGKIDLSRALEKGIYDVTINIYTNKLDTGAEMNKGQLNVELTVA